MKKYRLEALSKNSKVGRGEVRNLAKGEGDVFSSLISCNAYLFLEFTINALMHSPYRLERKA